MFVTEEGMTVNKSCRAVGNPDPAVQWFYGNKSISKEDMEKSDMSLLDINRTQQGYYYCIAHVISLQHGLLESRAVVEIIVNCTYYDTVSLSFPLNTIKNVNC